MPRLEDGQISYNEFCDTLIDEDYTYAFGQQGRCASHRHRCSTVHVDIRGNDEAAAQAEPGPSRPSLALHRSFRLP